MNGIQKGSRHQKIVGNFGEYLVCNWLSRSGFEVCVVDHTGMDIIAYDPTTEQRLGITVKSRTRVSHTEYDSVYLFRENKNDRQKLADACKAFNCEPWIAVYAECEDCADLFLTSLDNYDRSYKAKGKKVVDGWGMRPKHTTAYSLDHQVKHIHITFSSNNWWGNSGQSKVGRLNEERL